MRKVFLNYDEQIRKLIHEKQLIIKDKEYAIEMLKRYSYYSLIGGYREKFKNPETKRYYAGTCFEDIVALYEFDEQLREIFLRYLLKIEGQIKSHLSFYFCQKHGELQSEYLNPLNYNNIKKNRGDITKLIKTMSRYTSGKTDYQYINHAARKYGNVPLWVLMNALTFGNISKMYLLSQCDIQTQIAKNYIGVSEKEMTNFLAVLTQFRNVCAHGERLFTHRTKIAIPTMTLHKKLKLPKRGKEYIYGKHDLFAVVITMRYLLPSDWFKDFKKELTKAIRYYINKSKYFSEKQLLEFMGFPENWKKITRYKK